MIQAGVIYYLQNRMDCTRLWIVGAIYQTADASMHRSSRAHGARLNCSKQFAVAEPVISDVSSRLAQRHDFRMRGGVVVGEIAIPSSSHDASRAYDHRSHGYFSGIERTLGAAEGLDHPKLVARRILGGKFVGGWQLYVTSGGCRESSLRALF